MCVTNSGNWKSDLGALELSESEIYETDPNKREIKEHICKS